MANELLWLPKTVAEVIATAQLDNVADGALAIGASDYANHTNKYRFGSFFFKGTAFDAQCDVGALLELHLFYKFDGSLYADGEEGDVASPVPSGNSKHGIFLIGATAGPVYQQVLDVPLLPYAFRVALKLVTGQDLADSSAHFLKLYPHNEHLQ